MKAEVVLLCEDRQTDAFVRRFLAHRFKSRQIQTLPLPAGRQSGEQWVRSQFPKQLKAIRQRERTFLIVVVDADNLTTTERRQQLDQECRDKRIPLRSADDRALVLTPKRNIETWLAWLDGDETAVSEQEEHPKLRRERDCQPMAERLYNMCHEAQRLDDPCPPSLLEACDEYQRLSANAPQA